MAQSVRIIGETFGRHFFLRPLLIRQSAGEASPDVAELLADRKVGAHAADIVTCQPLGNLPNSRKVRLALWRSWRRRIEIRPAVFKPWDAGSRVIQPLRIENRSTIPEHSKHERH